MYELNKTYYHQFVRQVTEIEIKSTKAPVINIEVPKPLEILSVVKTDTTEFPAEVKEALDNGTASLNVEITNIELTDETNKEQIDKIKSELGANEQIGAIFDIDLLLKYDDKSVNVSELTAAQSFTIDIPESLRNKGYVFYMMNNHNGTIKKIDSTLSADGSKMTFLASEFSLYTLNYKTAASDIENPKTSDSILLFVGIACVGILGIGLVFKYRKAVK